MTASKTFLMILTFGIMFHATQAKIIVVNPDDDLNAIINNTEGGDTILVKPGTYTNVILSNKKYSEKKPLVVRAYGSGTVIVSGDTITRGSSLEINNCSYMVVDGLTFINAMWGIYVKRSDHIILRNNEISLLSGYKSNSFSWL